VTSLVYFCL